MLIRNCGITSRAPNKAVIPLQCLCSSLFGASIECPSLFGASIECPSLFGASIECPALFGASIEALAFGNFDLPGRKLLVNAQRASTRILKMSCLISIHAACIQSAGEWPSVRAGESALRGFQRLDPRSVGKKSSMRVGAGT